jgi:hypothetical protein
MFLSISDKKAKRKPDKYGAEPVSVKAASVKYDRLSGMNESIVKRKINFNSRITRKGAAGTNRNKGFLVRKSISFLIILLSIH